MIRQQISVKRTQKFVMRVLGEDIHAKRVLSLSNAAVGAMTSASLAVSLIGRGLAQARGLETKHAVKQVDRMLSNLKIDMDKILLRWVGYVVGARQSITVAMDWTEFDADNQATLMLSLLTNHGRATPLYWMTVDKSTLKGRRNEYEYQVLVRLAEALPADVKVRIVADRGFGDHKLYHVLSEELKFDFVIRFRGNIAVTAENGETRPASEWITHNGRARTLRNAKVTANEYPVGTVVCVWAKDMKEPWCLATNETNEKAQTLMRLYGDRWGIECGFRDAKNIRFGMGMGSVHVSTPGRRDRLWFIAAIAVALLTILGAVSEAVGYDRLLKSNTSKKRTHSLFRQGCMIYDLIPMMPEFWLRTIIEKFDEMLAQIPLFAAVREAI